jgi:hypothetical protein
MVEDDEVVADQSSFEMSQEVLQAPPSRPGESPNSRKKMWLLIGIGIFILITTLVVLGSPRRIEVLPNATPIPTPTPFTKTSGLRQELEGLNRKIQEANPDDVLVSPPQVDMNIEF